MKRLRRLFVCLVCLCVVMSAQGCGSIAGVSSGKRIIRISHAQSETHPEHLGLLKFKEYVEENLGDKYEVQIYPNEILGSAQKAIELIGRSIRIAAEDGENGPRLRPGQYGDGNGTVRIHRAEAGAVEVYPQRRM